MIKITIDAIHDVVIRNINKDLIDSQRTWIYLPVLRLIDACRDCYYGGGSLPRLPAKTWGDLEPKKKTEAALLLQAQEFLAPLSEHKACRDIKMASRWTNLDYSPPSPMGGYIWKYTCEVVQQILWMTPEFRDGFSVGLDPGLGGRDGNPYQPLDSRMISWDCGYIAGLTVAYHSPEVQSWMDSLSVANKKESAE